VSGEQTDRAAIDEAVAAGDLVLATMACDRLSDDLTGAGDLAAAEQVTREGIAYLRSIGDEHGHDGFVEGSTLRLYARLMYLVRPSPEALALADELVDVMLKGRAHPMDVAEALAIRACANVDCGTIDQAMTAARLAVSQSEDVCFHELSRETEEAVAGRLRREGRGAEADVWAARADGRLDLVIPGHVHLWELEFADDGMLVPRPKSRQHGGPDYEKTPGHQPFAAI